MAYDSETIGNLVHRLRIARQERQALEALEEFFTRSIGQACGYLPHSHATPLTPEEKAVIDGFVDTFVKAYPNLFQSLKATVMTIDTYPLATPYQESTEALRR